MTRIGRALMLCTPLVLGLNACDDASSPNGHAAREAVSVPAHKVKWLEQSNPLSPAQWLVSRDEEKPRPLQDSEVRRIGELLMIANKRYRESERMIANRSVQVEDMLEGLGLHEEAKEILQQLVDIGGEAGQTEGFGAISQHYFNLRAAKVERAVALSTLKARYGSRS